MILVLNKFCKSVLLLFSLLSFGLVSGAQVDAYFSVVKDSISGLPNFYAKKSKHASARINTYLELANLQQIRLNLPDSSLTESWVYHVFTNNKRYLSISVSKLEDDREKTIQNYCFNSATGEVIGIQDIFTPNGIAFIKKNNLKNSLSEIKSENLPFTPAQIKKSLKNDIHNFTISEDTLIVYNNKAFSADSAGNPSDYAAKMGFSTRVMSGFLATYGQAMFGVNRRLKMKKMVSSQLVGLYQGKLDGEPILIQLSAPYDKELDGVLYFPNSKKAMPLAGIFKSNRFEAQTALGKLSMYISGGKIQGNVKDANKKISYLNLEKEQ